MGWKKQAQLTDAFEQGAISLRCSDIQHHDSNLACAREPQQSRESAIERNRRALFQQTHVEKQIIGNTFEMLLANGRDVMSSRLEDFGACRSDIFVQLEFHAISGSGRTVSRDASAP